MAKKSIFDGYSEEVLQGMYDSAEKTPMGSLLFEERFIDPNAVGKELVYDWDSQPREVTDGRGLVDSICRIGLQTMPVLAIYSGIDVAEVAEGHRRLDACCIISKERPDDYIRNFPNGVPVRVAIGKVVDDVRSELTHLDMHLLRADHDLDSLTCSLGTKIECVRLTRPLWEAGMTLTAVMFHCWRTVSRIMSKKYNQLCEDMDAASPAQQVKILNDSQHGNFQFLKAVVLSPQCVCDAWAAGEKQDGPILTQEVVKKLASDFHKDVKTADDTPGAKKVDRDNPNPDWAIKFNDVITEAKKPKAEKTTKAKMLKLSKIEEMLTKVKADPGRLLLQAVLNKEGAETLYFNGYDVAVDAFCNLREAFPRFTAAMLELATTIDADITKEQYTAINAVFQSDHVETAKGSVPTGKEPKGEKKSKAKAKAKA